jgi:hypothetical protein
MTAPQIAVDMEDRRGGVRGNSETIARRSSTARMVRMFSNMPGVDGVVPKDVAALGAGDCEESRDFCGEIKRGALMRQ